MDLFPEKFPNFIFIYCAIARGGAAGCELGLRTDHAAASKSIELLQGFGVAAPSAVAFFSGGVRSPLPPPPPPPPT
jgi:hypothetical protein